MPVYLSLLHSFERNIYTTKTNNSPFGEGIHIKHLVTRCSFKPVAYYICIGFAQTFDCPQVVKEYIAFIKPKHSLAFRKNHFHGKNFYIILSTCLSQKILYYRNIPIICFMFSSPITGVFSILPSSLVIISHNNI